MLNIASAHLSPALRAVMIACLLSAAGTVARAAGPWTAGQINDGVTYSLGTFPNKQQAVATMENSFGAAGFLNQESLFTLTPTAVTYHYIAPNVPEAFSAWTFSDTCYPASCNPDVPVTSSQSALIAEIVTLYQQNTLLCAGTVSVTLVGPLLQLGGSNPPAGPYDLVDYQSYDVMAAFAPNCTAPPQIVIQAEMFQYRTGSCPPSNVYGLQNGVCISDTTGYVSGPINSPCSSTAGPPTTVGDPCDVLTGDFSQTETDYSGASLPFARYYHSATLESSHNLGMGWTYNYAASLILASGVPVGLLRPDGHQDAVQAINGEYISLSGSGIHIQPSGSNWIASLPDGSTEVYNSTGQLTGLVSAAGLATTLAYSSTSGLLSSVTGPFGHKLQLAYDSSNRLITVTDPDGTSEIQYTYDGNNNLVSVTYPDSSVRQYLYQDSSLQNNLTGIVDESTSQFLTVKYDPNTGVAISSQQAGGAQAVSISYSSNAAVVTDALGATHTYDFTTNSGYAPRVASLTVNGLVQTYTVPAPGTDPQQRVTQTTDANSNITTYAYDTDHLTSKTEASGTSIARTSSYQYLRTTSALPTLDTEPLRQTSYAYYSGTNNIETRTVTDTTVTPNVSRTWTYTYDTYGRMLTAKGPRTDVNSTTTYTYYTCTTGVQCGQVETVADAVGNVTTYNTYDAHGQPLTITDPNGVVTTLTYDSRQRLTSRQVGTETTSFSHYPTGLLETITLPDGSSLTYTYDGAHRLIQIADGSGNKAVFTLDAMGNRTAESAYDPTNTLSRTLSRVYNSLNELYQLIGAAGTSGVTTTYGYDNDGNQTAVSAPLSRNAANTYDALNRLSQITDPNNGITKLAYDAEDDVTSVTDPRSIVDSYTYNGFGDVATEQIADVGIATAYRTYDSGGNLATYTDQRGAVTTYTYDKANRVTSAAFKKGTVTDQTITYTYDSGTYGKGRLAGASDANHSMSWSYDALGRVTSKGQTVAGITKTVGYLYTNGDLTTLTTPSGQTVTYAYSNHQITSISVNSTTLLSGVSYEPFGPARGWSWANGNSEIRLYNTDGNPSQLSGLESTSYTYDNAFRIAGITNSSNSSLSWTYGYDVLDRLTSATRTGTTQGFTYDADGNRRTETGTVSGTYNVSTASNRLNSVTGTPARSYTFDQDADVLTYAGITLTYNDRDRLATANSSGQTTSYVYNALGQRIEKSGGPAGTVIFVYDEAGHLQGEYTSSGSLIEETIWLGDIPVATLQPNGSGITAYYIHADHLNTAKMITRASDNAVMWRWDQDPFGSLAPNQNPSGLGTFVYNLRFPGQYYDSETGLNQNRYRDYDPSVGRYVESDPIGLKGRSYSTFDYAKASPIGHIDPSGLVTAADEATATGQIPLASLQPPPSVSPELKTYLCKLISDCKGDFNCVFNDVNADRNGNYGDPTGPSNPNTWNDPLLRNAENFAAAASGDALPFPVITDTPVGIYLYQYVVKKWLYPAFGKPTSPVSDAAYQAGLAGMYWHDRNSRTDAMKWCDKNSCSRQ